MVRKSSFVLQMTPPPSSSGTVPLSPSLHRVCALETSSVAATLRWVPFSGLSREISHERTLCGSLLQLALQTRKRDFLGVSVQSASMNCWSRSRSIRAHLLKEGLMPKHTLKLPPDTSGAEFT